MAKKTGQALVIGTTGLTDEDEQLLHDAAKTTPILYCANTSMGVNLLLKLVQKAASALGDEWDIEIVETHHNQKIDAPSGTALALGQAAAQGRGVQLEDVRDAGRDGITGARTKGDIGFAVMRGGNVAGEHSVMFYGEDERIELTHIANQRTIFARGACQRLVLWLASLRVFTAWMMCWFIAVKKSEHCPCSGSDKFFINQFFDSLLFCCGKNAPIS